MVGRYPIRLESLTPQRALILKALLRAYRFLPGSVAL